MRSFPSGVSDQMMARGGMYARVLLWVEAKNATTGAPEPQGIWNGEYDTTFVIGGVSRPYVGGGGLLSVEPLTFRVGLDTQFQRVTLSPLGPDVASLIRGLDVRLAPVEIHQAVYSVESGSLLGEPKRWFKGYLDSVQVSTPQVGGQAAVDLTLASQTRDLTRTLPIFKSDEGQKRRGGDRFRRYADVSGQVAVFWGEGGPGGGHVASGGGSSGKRRPTERGEGRGDGGWSSGRDDRFDSGKVW